MRTLIVAAALLAGTGAAPAAPPEWEKAKRLLPAYLWIRDPGLRDTARLDARWAEGGFDGLRLTKAQFRELGEILRNGSPYTTEKRRAPTLRIPTGEKDETLPVRVTVCGAYKPGCGKSFPLVVTLHGGPAGTLREAEEGASTQFSAWNGQLSVFDGILAAPALTGETSGPRERTFLRNLVDELDRLYNVDRDRVLLTGHSWGGILTWRLGPPDADAWSLLAPFVCAVNPGRPHLSNLRALPVYHVQGEKDIDWIVKDGRARRDLLDGLKYEHVYRELHGGHELFGGELAPIAKRFTGSPRRMYAEEIVRCDPEGRNPSDLWYWVRTPGRTFTARCDRAAGEIRLEEGEDEVEVLLADEMLDLDRPVRVLRGGKVAFEGRVERSLKFALDLVRETGDRGRVFAASVKVD